MLLPWLLCGPFENAGFRMRRRMKIPGQPVHALSTTLNVNVSANFGKIVSKYHSLFSNLASWCHIRISKSLFFYALPRRPLVLDILQNLEMSWDFILSWKCLEKRSIVSRRSWKGP